MSIRDENDTTPESDATVTGSEADRLFERYGSDLDDEPLDDDEKRELLCALWRIMQSLVDLGFSVGRGEKFVPGSDLGMDDVLSYILLDDTAHETVAPETTNREHP